MDRENAIMLSQALTDPLPGADNEEEITRKFHILLFRRMKG
jgi:hypothetical protein